MITGKIDGGLQYVPSITMQYVYLDFDGELTSYNGEILTIDDVEVKNSNLNAERIAAIVSGLNAQYADQNVIFVTERPESVPYSTIFVGKTSAFDEYGNFAGISELIDKENSVKSDNAFVLLDSIATDTEIIKTISHETDHLLGTLHHDGAGLNAYGLVYSVYSPGTSARNLEVKSGDVAEFSDNCKVFSATVQSNGTLIINSGASALFVRENGGFVSTAQGATVTFDPNTIKSLNLSSASATVHKGTIIQILTVTDGGDMYVHAGGLISQTQISSGFIHVLPGGTVSSASVSSGGNVFIANNGIISSITANTGAYVYISSGGSGSVTENGGFVYIHNSAVVSISKSIFSNKILDGTSATVHSGTSANKSVLKNNGALYIYNGGVANFTHVLSGKIQVYNGAKVNSSIISNGSCNVQSGGSASGTTLKEEAVLRVFSGGNANQTTVEKQGKLRLEGNASTVTLTGGELYISSGATASSVKLSSGYLRCSGKVEKMEVFSGGEAQFFFGELSQTTIHSGGLVTIEDKSTCSGISVKKDGHLVITDSFILNGEKALDLEEDARVFLENNAEIIFSLTNSQPGSNSFINDFAQITGTGKFTIAAESNMEAGSYKLAQNINDFSQEISLRCGQKLYGSLSANDSAILKTGQTYTLECDKTNRELLLQIKENQPLSVPASSSSYQNYFYYSKDNFNSCIKIASSGNSLDIYGLQDGNYQWQNAGTDIFIQAQENNFSNEAKNIISEINEGIDLFFANASGVWETGYAAQHQGTLEGWTGTGEQILLDGKNKLADIFTGSTDASILVMTDDANGDALFVDDVYTQFGKDAARISQIDEIRAGAGDDIVDMTSQQFAYVGNGVKIYGGLGNDTIWANSGNNTLFGDAGNDRIAGAAGDDFIIGGSGDDSLHGGGGNDTFCFGSDWGVDTVEQLAGGKVTLWFESNSGSWNENTLTYTDGTNSVTVSGVTEVTLKFGDTATAPAGAFMDAASEKIFEDKDKGMIA